MLERVPTGDAVYQPRGGFCGTTAIRSDGICGAVAKIA